MPLTLDALLKRSAELELQVAGETFRITYAPAKLTMAVRRNLLRGVGAYLPEVGIEDAATAGDAAYLAYCTELAGVLLSWDVMDGKTMYPLTGASLAQLDDIFVVSLGQEVAKDSRGNPQSAVRLNSTSPTTAV